MVINMILLSFHTHDRSLRVSLASSLWLLLTSTPSPFLALLLCYSCFRYYLLVPQVVVYTAAKVLQWKFDDVTSLHKKLSGFFFSSRLHIQQGAWTREPEIESRALPPEPPRCPPSVALYRLLCIYHAWRKLSQHTHFLHKEHHCLLVLRNPRHHFSTVLGGHFKQWNHRQNTEM